MTVKTVLRRLLPGLAGLGLAASALAESPAVPLGAELLKPFKQQLMGALKSGLQQGPAEAIEACKLKAPEIAANLSVEDVEMGRTSHRLRNPDNAAPGWVAPVLERWLADEASARPVELDAGEGRRGYIEPIRMQAEPCLMCHGDTLEPAIAERVGALYPEDRATGFREGDLRGVFWVSYPGN